ncbi:amidohydrolase [Pontibacillus halophilus JSM 076056 = DSM 19796]|uniref:Peptidase M20 domain-containing protein 2 n=1 Tax=Pontibacillus halophilus JSM 076056 = DSM 19796 TaxID=1385510 RepID=A0A0A5GHH7_9BACI|nr:M20 family metallopeptidase [Pontibacillus halophilus]KGX92721.1 amidohydrolase [Pontibacillus halophilus JSM 076056 = DSM 19796]
MAIAVESLERRIIKSIEENRQAYVATSHAIHERPEIGNEEYFATAQLQRLLEEAGFDVQAGIPEHDTAFIARKKSALDGPKIGYLAEYDALPGLGHACGHNLIGTTSVAAAIALAEVIDEVGGEVVVLGTPAEEGGPNGSAKGTFVRHGLVQDLDAAMMVHPQAETSGTSPSLAVDPIDFEFFGVSAHAAANPEAGINALDGVIQLYNGVNAMRQHVTDDVRIHGVILDGGEAPNVVPDYARARFYIRAKTRESCNDITAVVKQIAEGAALQTGATMKATHIQNGVDHLVLNEAFDELFKKHIVDLGEEYKHSKIGIGSTDAGNISRVVPTIHPYIKIGDSNLVPHTDAFREAAKSEVGDKALMKGAKALALTGLDLLTKPMILRVIQEEFKSNV